MMRHYGSVARAAWSLLILFSSCVSLERSFPDKHYFVLDVGDTPPRPNPSGEKTLQISSLRVSPRYADRSFVYRTSEAGYESDFYNQFLTSPESMLGEEIRKGLAASSVFKHVIGPTSQLPPNYVLEGSVNALYGDFRNLTAPSAVLEIEFFLHNEDSANLGIVLQKRYMKTVFINGRTPEALVKGWSQALQGIITDLSGDLERIKS